jgi:hypothetical protein
MFANRALELARMKNWAPSLTITLIIASLCGMLITAGLQANDSPLLQLWAIRMDSGNFVDSALSSNGELLLSIDHELVSIDVKGRERWRVLTDGLCHNMQVSGSGDKIYADCSASFACFAAIDGRLLWEGPEDDEDWFFSELTPSAAGPIFAHTGYGELCRVVDGKVEWTFADQGDWLGCTNYSGMAVSPDGSCNLLGLPSTPMGSAATLYHLDQNGNVLWIRERTSGSIAYDSTGMLYCLNHYDAVEQAESIEAPVVLQAIDSAGEVQWQSALPPRYRRCWIEQSSIGDDRIYALGSTGLVAFDRQGNLVFEFERGYWSSVSRCFALSGDKVIFAGVSVYDPKGYELPEHSGGLWLMDRDGTLLHYMDAEEGVTRTLRAAGEYASYMDNDKLRAFKLKDGARPQLTAGDA